MTVDVADWVDLAKPLINNVYVDLPPTAMALYKAMEREMFIAISDRHAEAANAAGRTSKCLQIANGSVYLTDGEDGREWREIHAEKIQALASIVHETGGVPLMVCYEFRSDLARLLAAFPSGRALVCQQDEDDFRSGLIPLLFLHPKSGGHGIDGFQAPCNNIVFFGHNWSLGQYLQVIERIGPTRQMQAGLRRAVTVHHIIARGTVDELVMERRESKRATQDILLDACKRMRGEG